MKSFTFPGIVWVVLLVALPMLSQWLEQYFAWAEWAAPLAGLLLIAAKVVEVVRAQRFVTSPPPGVAAEDVVEVQAPPSLWWG
jgi:hypothetical protein